MPATGRWRSSPAYSAAVTGVNEIFWYFLKLGWLAFGGPDGQIGLMHLQVVERQKWIDEDEFVRAGHRLLRRLLLRQAAVPRRPARLRPRLRRARRAGAGSRPALAGAGACRDRRATAHRHLHVLPQSRPLLVRRRVRGAALHPR